MKKILAVFSILASVSIVYVLVSGNLGGDDVVETAQVSASNGNNGNNENNNDMRDQIPGLEVAQSKVPYHITLPDPSLIPEDIRAEVTHKVEKIDNRDSVELGVSNVEELSYVNYFFGNPTRNISISQVEESGRPDYLNELDLITVDGVDVYVERFDEKMMKMYFWKDEMFYLVKGEDITQNELEEIIKSML